MSFRRRLCVLPLALLLIALPSLVRAQSANEVDLREILLDSRAFLDAGSFSYNDYSARATSVAIQLDRYKRRGGKNEHLIAASEYFIEAKLQWEAFFQYEREQDRLDAIAGTTSRELIETKYRKQKALLELRNESWAQFHNSLMKYTGSATQKKSKQSTKN
jgi:hypothetical protein